MKTANHIAISIALALGLLSSTPSYASDSYLDGDKQDPSKRQAQQNVLQNQEGNISDKQQASSSQFKPTKKDLSIPVDSSGKRVATGKAKVSKTTGGVTFRSNNYPGLVLVNPQILPMIPGGWQMIR